MNSPFQSYWRLLLKRLLLKRLQMQPPLLFPQASWSSSRNSLCWHQTLVTSVGASLHVITTMTCSLEKRIGIGAFVQYKSMPRMRQEQEGSHLFFSICTSSFDWNISSWTLLWLRNIWKALALTVLHVLTKKKTTLCLLLPAPFLSNGLLCWRM